MTGRSRQSRRDQALGASSGSPYSRRRALGNEVRHATGDDLGDRDDTRLVSARIEAWPRTGANLQHALRRDGHEQEAVAEDPARRFSFGDRGLGRDERFHAQACSVSAVRRASGSLRCWRARALPSMFISASSARRGKENVWSRDQYADTGQERATELGARSGITSDEYSTATIGEPAGRDPDARATTRLSRTGRSGPSTSL